jgi:2-polyprenyl-3-methyl-5-hydroxy-6-metoxy-1,4-benzoquinol methylase
MKRVYEENINPVAYDVPGGEILQEQYDRPDRVMLFCAISPFIDPEDTILDIGCGGGREIRVMREFGLKNKIAVADYWATALEFIHSKNLDVDNYYKQDFEQEINIEKHDIVLCTEVIEHMNAPVDFIKRLKSLANKRLIITCPNGPHMAERQHIWQIYKEDLAFDGAIVLEISIFQYRDHLLAVYNI